MMKITSKELSYQFCGSMYHLQNVLFFEDCKEVHWRLETVIKPSALSKQLGFSLGLLCLQTPF